MNRPAQPRPRGRRYTKPEPQPLPTKTAEELADELARTPWCSARCARIWHGIAVSDEDRDNWRRASKRRVAA